MQAQHPRFVVGPDEALSYPGNLTDLADEHTTVFPPTFGFPKYLFFASSGFARSSDNGKTWPDPIDSEFGGVNRYPVLKNPIPEPMTPEDPQVAIGNAIPGARRA